jgi:hypothetical protein
MKLWAIMLQNCPDTFISRCTTRRFLDTLEVLLTSSRTPHIVRARVLDVIAAAAYTQWIRCVRGVYFAIFN